MSEYIALMCNLCGKHITSNIVSVNGEAYKTIKVKAKKWWCSLYDGGWNKETIHICPFCQSKIREILRGDTE